MSWMRSKSRAPPEPRSGALKVYPRIPSTLGATSLHLGIDNISNTTSNTIRHYQVQYGLLSLLHSLPRTPQSHLHLHLHKPLRHHSRPRNHLPTPSTHTNMSQNPARSSRNVLLPDAFQCTPGRWSLNSSGKLVASVGAGNSAKHM